MNYPDHYDNLKMMSYTRPSVCIWQLNAENAVVIEITFYNFNTKAVTVDIVIHSPFSEVIL